MSQNLKKYLVETMKLNQLEHQYTRAIVEENCMCIMAAVEKQGTCKPEVVLELSRLAKQKSEKADLVGNKIIHQRMVVEAAVAGLDESDSTQSQK